MKEWNVHIATSVNKSILAASIAAVCLGLFPINAVAQQANAPQAVAPSLYAIGEIQVQQPRLASQSVAESCGVSSVDVLYLTLRSLKNDGLPAFSVMNAPAAKEDVARIDLLPTISTIQASESTCTSWVSFSAQSRTLIVLPPIKLPRSVVLTCWEGGLLVHSTRASHPQSLVNAIDKLATQFSRQYQLDQPPDLSEPKAEAKP